MSADLEFDNNEEDRGYESELNFNDTFATVWVTIWIIPITYVLFLMIKTNISHKDNTKKSRKGNKIWSLGFFVCICFYLVQCFDISSWIGFIITFSYSETSVSYISDVAIFFCWMLSNTFLYLFFIYRLYLVYNGQDKSMFSVGKCWYIILLTINFIYFLSLALIVVSWIIFDDTLYVIGHGTCLLLEIIMYLILMRLFSKPLLKLSKTHRAHSISNAPSSPRSMSMSRSRSRIDSAMERQDFMLILLARMNILNSVALCTTIFNRIFEIASYLYCPDECWLTYISYCLLSVDVFTNIFCILCSFASGKKYYDKWCKCLHNFVMMHLERDNDMGQLQMHHVTSQTETPTSPSVGASDEKVALGKRSRIATDSVPPQMESIDLNFKVSQETINESKAYRSVAGIRIE